MNRTVPSSILRNCNPDTLYQLVYLCCASMLHVTPLDNSMGLGVNPLKTVSVLNNATTLCNLSVISWAENVRKHVTIHNPNEFLFCFKCLYKLCSCTCRLGYCEQELNRVVIFVPKTNMSFVHVPVVSAIVNHQEAVAETTNKQQYSCCIISMFPE